MLGHRAKADASSFQIGDDVEQVRQRAAEAIELLDYEHVAGAEVGEAGLKAGTVVLRAGRAIGVEMTLVDPGRGERVALQVDGLAIVGGGNTHVPDQHAR